MNAARAVLFDTVLLLTFLCLAFAALCTVADWLESRGEKEFKWWD